MLLLLSHLRLYQNTCHKVVLDVCRLRIRVLSSGTGQQSDVVNVFNSWWQLAVKGLAMEDYLQVGSQL